MITTLPRTFTTAMSPTHVRRSSKSQGAEEGMSAHVLRRVQQIAPSHGCNGCRSCKRCARYDSCSIIVCHCPPWDVSLSAGVHHLNGGPRQTAVHGDGPPHSRTSERVEIEREPVEMRRLHPTEARETGAPILAETSPDHGKVRDRLNDRQGATGGQGFICTCAELRRGASARRGSANVTAPLNDRT